MPAGISQRKALARRMGRPVSDPPTAQNLAARVTRARDTADELNALLLTMGAPWHVSYLAVRDVRRALDRLLVQISDLPPSKED